jgi:DNA-binding transcriptional MerR regulator
MTSKPAPATLYRIQEFAKAAGVTVRALHHYDRLGLLKPSARSAAGYRLYRDSDFARLEQIVVLKFLGFPLKDISRLLRRESDLASVLQRQRRVLAEKLERLKRAIDAIGAAEHSLVSGTAPKWELFTTIVQEIEMQQNTEWSKKYYSPNAQAKVEERRQLWSPELQERVTKEWTALVADVDAALGEDPASARAQALAARWRKLLEGFTGGDPEVQKGLNKMWADKANWPEAERNRFHIKPEIQEFIVKAISMGR